MTTELKPFDFEQHEQAAIAAYQKVHSYYSGLAEVMKRILIESIKNRKILTHSVEGRAKDPLSFGKKAAKPSENDPNLPRYPNPLSDIKDMAGIRIITYFPSTQVDIDKMIEAEFRIIEKSDKGAELIEEDKFGYKSIHYLVKIHKKRASLPEYSQYADSIAEIQVRTILQHAWAEIEHDIQYKSSSIIPPEIHRRFSSLAGLLEIADREFQGIQDDDRKQRESDASKIQDGDLENVLITPNSLKIFLDKRFGPDGRLSDFSYEWTVRLLKKLGFSSLSQIETCIGEYNDYEISRIAKATRQGQTTRFELLLLAGMGENYIKRHIFATEAWFGASDRLLLEEFKQRGIKAGDYDPLAPKESQKESSEALENQTPTSEDTP